jgi:hypothetical protein
MQDVLHFPFQSHMHAIAIQTSQITITLNHTQS